MPSPVCSGAPATGPSAAAQIPAGLLAERIGSVWMLGLGTALQGAGYVALLLAVGYPLTLILILAAGIGGGVYHPVGTGLVSNLYPPERTGPPIGTLNFFGDVGKVIFPALAGVLAVRVGWQGSFASLGCIGLAVALLYLFFFRRELFPVREKRPRRNSDGRGLWKKGIRQPVQFSVYSTLGFLDETIRSGSFTFLGFMLIANGIEKGAIGWYLSLTFFGGACGKLLCGMPIARVGARRIIVITELLVVAGCLAIPSMSSGWAAVRSPAAVRLCPQWNIFGDLYRACAYPGGGVQEPGLRPVLHHKFHRSGHCTVYFWTRG